MVCSGSLRADRRAEKLDIMTKIQQCQEKLGEKKVEIKTSLKLKPPLPRGGVQSASSLVPRRPDSPKSQSPKSWRGLDPLPKGSVSDALLGIERLLAREKQIMAEFNAALANSVQQEALVRIFKKKIKRKKVQPSLPLTNETPASQNIESLRPGGEGVFQVHGQSVVAVCSGSGGHTPLGAWAQVAVHNDDDDSSGDSDDESSDDSDEEDEEEEVCPPGCDPATYKKVVELREKRMGGGLAVGLPKHAGMGVWARMVQCRLPPFC